MKLAPLAPLCFLAACAAAPDEPLDPTTSAQVLVMEDGQVLSGLVEADTITVPEGATIRFDGDTTLRAETIHVHGRLVGVGLAEGPPPAGADPDTVRVDAPVLHLVATREVRVELGALVRGADAASIAEWPAAYDGRSGGRGGDVIVESPNSIVDGRVVGGNGGAAPLGGAGGKGGGAYSAGHSGTTVPGGGGGYFGGEGGSGGPGRQAEIVDGELLPSLPTGTPGAGGDAGRAPADRIPAVADAP